MTNEQFDYLILVLERIATALEPKSAGRTDVGNEEIPQGGGRRIRMTKFVEGMIEERVKTTALNPKK